jgi:hypothetical protein
MIGSWFTLESTANPCRTPLAPMVTSELPTTGQQTGLVNTRKFAVTNSVALRIPDFFYLDEDSASFSRINQERCK